jgi:hypothetical protein
VERFSVTNSGSTSVTGSLSVTGGQGSLNVYSPGTDPNVKTNVVIHTSGKSFMEFGLDNGGGQYTPYLYCDNSTGGRNGGSFAGFVFTTTSTGDMNTRSLYPLATNTYRLGAPSNRYLDSYIGYMYVGVNILPLSNNTSNIGLSGLQFKQIYCETVYQSSDERLKENITDSPLGLSFINALRPVSYKFKDYNVEGPPDANNNTETIHHTYTKTNYGLLAQQVQSTVTNSGLSLNDFAGISYDPEKDSYSLSYTEFISPMIKAIQELSTTLSAVQSRLAIAEEKLTRHNIT